MSEETLSAKKQLARLYNDTDDMIETHINWYQERVWRYRVGTQFIRITGFLALCVGIAYPAIFPDNGFKIPYFSILAGGLILLADRIFMFSRSWVRYVQAQLGLEATRAELRYDWMKLDGLIDSDNDARAKWNDVVDVLKSAAARAGKIVVDETASWQGELDQALKALSDQIDSTVKSTLASRGESEGKLSEERAAQRVGSLNLTVKSDNEAITEFSVGIGKNIKTDLTIPAQLSFGGLAPGQQIVVAKGKRSNGSSAVIERSIEIKAGLIVTETINFDSV